MDRLLLLLLGDSLFIDDLGILVDYGDADVSVELLDRVVENGSRRLIDLVCVSLLALDVDLAILVLFPLHLLVENVCLAFFQLSIACGNAFRCFGVFADHGDEPSSK